ncbi:MAG TPA: PadR family transcriptional regulator [Anaerolineaceae bacterium]|nr:PadR family transcriptional regulator [Anaerolineaceae bacterium]
MSIDKARKRYVPMSETMFYILLSLKQEQHGYAIMQHVKELTKGRISLGAGTVYSSLGKLESDGLIKSIREEDRRIIYLITALGKQILQEEAERMAELCSNYQETL